MALILLRAAAVARSTLSLGAHGEIEVNGKAWFHAGNVSVTVGGTTYSTSDASLTPVGAPTESSGHDGFGAFTSKAQRWTAGTTPYTTSTRIYADRFAIFEQSWPNGASGTNITQLEGSSIVSSCYPSIDPRPVGDATLGYVSWEGRAFLEGSKGGTWDGSGGPPGPGMGDGGGPFLVFDEMMSDSLVFAPASNFMTVSAGMSKAPGASSIVDANAQGANVVAHDETRRFAHPGAGMLSEATPAPASDGSFCFGLDAPVESVPAGYSLETIVHLGTGVNAAMKEWGTTMLDKYKTVRPADFASEWLGFSTDNGAYYYYGWHPTATTPDYSNYEDALTGVHGYAAKEDIPYKHVLLDSWWYTKGEAGGVKEWDATGSTFPHGLRAFATTTGWRFMMHNRHWSDDNVYGSKNGGKYAFVYTPNGSQMAMPTEQALWDDLMANKTQGGVPLSVYEQDWLYNEWQGVAEARASPTLSRQWLMQMGAGAAKVNTTIQYCMSLARNILQTIEIPSVTTFRASDDYGPGQTGYYPTKRTGKPPTNGSTGCTFPYCVYYVGTTSIIAHALNLKPSKDNYWSTALQRGSAFNRNPWQPTFLNDTHEPYNEMQSAISSYTTAMVAPSDGVGFSNASLIKMACRSDGRLLQPSAPARAIDASFALSGAPANRVENVHAVMATHSAIGSAKWAHVLTIGLAAAFDLSPAHLTVSGDLDAVGEHLAWSGYQASGSVGTRPANITLLGVFSDAHPLQLPKCAYSNFGLHHVAPIFAHSSAALLGEVGKWVPVADDRIVKVADSAAGLAVDVVGAAGEAVELAFAARSATSAASALCTLSATGKATFTFNGKTVACT